jgi:hypothetical protein
MGNTYSLIMREMILFFLAVVGLMARDPLTVARDRAPQVFAGKVVAVQLTSDARVRRRWVSAAPGTVGIAVKKTSDQR